MKPLVLSASLLLAAWCPALAAPPTLDIYWIDVEGGAATLIVTPARESILIDSGENKPHHINRMFDVATKAAGLKAIDHFVISHWHADHYGGTYELGKRLPLRRFYANTEPPDRVDDDPVFAPLIALYKKANPGKTTALKGGTTLALNQAPGAPPVKLVVLASGRSPGPLTAEVRPKNPVCATAVKPPPLDDGENAKSLALVLQYGGFRFFDAGDLTWHIEEQLACPANLIGDVDLYQVTHHGLDRSNNPHLVHSLRPRVAVVNNGAQKGAEPNSMRTVLSAPRLEAAWQLYSNPKTGPKLNAPPLRIANPLGSSGGEYLKASIRPDGSFSVQIGEHGYSESYKAPGAR